MKWIKGFHIFKAFKIALAAVLSILTANLLGLNYAITAGIITVLSIQNTKRETLQTARDRGLAFLCALMLSYVCFRWLDFSVTAFIVYLFLFALLCLSAGWGQALAMDSVLISHFLTEQRFDRAMFVNELLVFAIGTFYGILINLHLRKKEVEFDRLSRQVDDEIKGIIHRMAENIRREDKTNYNSDCFVRLEDKLHLAKECALRNWNNTLWSQSAYELDYIRMRENQSRVLKNIYDSIVRITMLPSQNHRDNNVEKLLELLEKMLSDMKLEALPQSREEFEARALLFYTLMQLEEFLILKNRFVAKYQNIL